MIATTTDTVVVRTTDDIPTLLVWNGVRYRVSDTPTELWDTVAHPMLTHPLDMVIGWRFQGTAEDGATRVFDVRPRKGVEWDLLRTWQ